MGKLGILTEIIHFLLENKKFWLIPIVIVLVLFGIVVVFAQSSPAAPFIYTFF